VHGEAVLGVLAVHKGYGVPEHLQALETYGPCPVHRLTYRPVLPRIVTLGGAG
jgi:ribonuclease HII